MFFLVVGGCFVDFFTIDEICILYDAYFFFGHFSDNTDTKSRSREWLTEYQSFRNSKLQTGFTDFIFEKITKWLNDFFEIYEIRKTTYVVMGFDHCRFSAKTTLYNVRINSSLCKEIHCSNLLCLFFENSDEFFTDDLTFCFRLCYTGKFIIVSLLRIDTDEIQIELSVWSEYTFHFITFVFAEKAMIYKYAGKLLSDCSGKETCCNRRINSTGQGKKYFAIANFFADFLNRMLNKSIHLPVTGTSTYTQYEVGQHCLSFYRMKYFRMELNCIQFLFCVFCCCYRAVCCMCRDFKSRCRFGNVICMAHPNDCFF